MFLVFDTETTGLIRSYSAPFSDSDNWPRVVQLAWQLHDEKGKLMEHGDFIIRPEGFDIPFSAEKIHGISTALALQEGTSLSEALDAFESAVGKAHRLVGHNLEFDRLVLQAEYYRLQRTCTWNEIPVIDTCQEDTAQLCQLPGGRNGKFKFPKLEELYAHLFSESIAQAHNATADVEASARVFVALAHRGFYSKERLGAAQEGFLAAFPTGVPLAGLIHRELKRASALWSDSPPSVEPQANQTEKGQEKLAPFFHAHAHSQFSVLQATASVVKLVQRAIEDQQPAIALTDSGNMMGAFQFVKAVQEHNKIRSEDQKELKALVGYEAFVCRDRLDKSQKDDGYQIPLLALTKKGYSNISKLSSAAFIEGFYYVPRIDKSNLASHAEDVVALTGGLYGEIPQLILNVGLRQAEDAFVWYKETFGDRFYAEINRHGLPEEEVVNKTLLAFCAKYNVPYIPANNAYYLDRTEAEAHDILLCVKNNEKKSTPIGRGRGFRFGFPNDSYHFATQAEMHVLFSDLPESFVSLQALAESVENYSLAREVLLPNFDIPTEFLHPDDANDTEKRGENGYLRHLAFEGAKKRYSEITPAIVDRLDFELETIQKTGYPGYFLIVQDFCHAARQMGVSVGPGRGSAAGSVVAYCTGITNVDPIRYDLLFERFLNPDRVSLPDIDIDFDDRGRDRVIQYVIDKYGSSQVAQIITYGTMAAKSSVKDTARVLDMSFAEADKISKSIPDGRGLVEMLETDEKKLRDSLRPEDYSKAMDLRKMAQETHTTEGAALKQARVLEGSLRNTGIHACGVIITPMDIRELIPVATAKDSAMWCTQFDNAVVESAGLLKMDFLGLRTLTIISDAVVLIQKRHGILLEREEIPVDDALTYALFQRGETVGIFQYESPGMQKHLKDLKPSVFGDLIAMNALYRPGPLEYIPSFIRRKHGTEAITYDLPDMQEFLEETYGITVYQEQVMRLSQKLAGFTKGQADVLRKAMGKKDAALLAKLKPQFLEGGNALQHDEVVLDKIWKDWEAFASYAFNKSHSTCYAWIAYQTAYLKANYPAEYMAAVLSNNMDDIKQVTFFMEEARRMKIPVLGPDVNESDFPFSVNTAGAIRFGLGGMRGVGGGAVEHLISERTSRGPFTTLYDFVRRVDLRTVNRGTLEALAAGGAFDGLQGTHRGHFFYEDVDGKSFLEKARRYGQGIQEAAMSNQASLFGESMGTEILEPTLPEVPVPNPLLVLKREKEINGVYISAHPLDEFRYERRAFIKNSIAELDSLETFIQGSTTKDFSVAGMVTAVTSRMTKSGREMGTLHLEDVDGSIELVLFGEDYLKFKHFLVTDQLLFVRGRVQKPSWGGKDGAPERWVMNVLDIRLLGGLLSSMGHSVHVHLPLEAIRPEFIQEVSELLHRHKGDKKITFYVGEGGSGPQVTLPSRTMKVRMEKSLFEGLEAVTGASVVIKATREK